ncbi:hypothetical protein RHGRI_013407 [Rhododendron griersonianum]|uniref:Jacalin-type lectin domain-containing protein n=1 Tax=Rhododendron griersonianum TaxID=479676 RepID=A0AAV6K5F1_9ERIC|nr:hypothetical protein RHGRI_013407 [Rhododendron griersonianum]
MEWSGEGGGGMVAVERWWCDSDSGMKVVQWWRCGGGSVVDDLQKIEEEIKIEIEERKKEMEGVAAENEGPKQRNEVMEVLIKKRNEIMSNIIVDEGGEILGPWGGHGGSFWAYKTNVTPIMEITLRYGEIIDSVLFKNYRRLNGDVVGCSNRIGGTGGHNHETV